MAASRLLNSCLKVVLLTASCSSALSGSVEVRGQRSVRKQQTQVRVSLNLISCQSLTSQSSDVQDVSYDLLADLLCGLFPGQLQTAGAQGQSLEAGGGLGQLGPLADGEAGAGLVGAGAVLCDALIDGLVLWGDTGDGQSPAGGEKEQIDIYRSLVRCNTGLYWQCKCHFLRVSIGQFDVAAGCQQFAVLQPDEVRFWSTGRRAAEDSAAPCWSGDRLRPLHKLWRSCRHRRRRRAVNIRYIIIIFFIIS